jgi:hypothetical protein
VHRPRRPPPQNARGADSYDHDTPDRKDQPQDGRYTRPPQPLPPQTHVPSHNRTLLTHGIGVVSRRTVATHDRPRRQPPPFPRSESHVYPAAVRRLVFERLTFRSRILHRAGGGMSARLLNPQDADRVHYRVGPENPTRNKGLKDKPGRKNRAATATQLNISKNMSSHRKGGNGPKYYLMPNIWITKYRTRSPYPPCRAWYHGVGPYAATPVYTGPLPNGPAK